MNIKEIDNTYIAHTYGRFPVHLVTGKGSVACDENGKEYIDLGTGIGVNLFGYCDETWQQAVKEQLGYIQHTSNLYYTGPCANLAKLLCEKTGMKKVFFCNSGAEANECAIKAARRYGQLHKGEGNYYIVTLENSFHGRTLTTLAATGQDHFHELFQPLTPGFVHAKPDDADSVRKLVEEYPCCAIMIECVQGEGGVHALKQEFIDEIKKIAQEHELLVICDEVQTGNGRTGALYSCMHYGLQPDIMTTAKGIGGGLPIGITMLGDKVQDIFKPGDNGSTFGGNPIACAGALANLKRLDDELMESVKAKSDHARARLMACEEVESLDGLGMMIGIKPKKAKNSDIAMKCLEKGVLVLTAGNNMVRLLPALNIDEKTLDKGISILIETLREEA